MLKICVKNGGKIKIGDGYIYVNISKEARRAWLTFDMPKEIEVKRIRNEKKSAEQRIIEQFHRGRLHEM